MDKIYKTNKTNLLEIFKKSATLLKYEEIEYNEITNKFNYRKKGSGLQFGASAHICVELTEKDGITNANFSCNAVKGFPLFESAKQTILSKWYSEFMTTSEKLLLLLGDDLINKNSDKNIQTNIVLQVEKEVQSNQKKNKSKAALFWISIILLISMIFIIPLSIKNESSNSSSSSINTIEGTESCLVGYNWVYPSRGNPVMAWKFSSGGTFNYGTKLLGIVGSDWGNWSVISPGKIRVSYTKTTIGIGNIPDDQILTMPSCNSLKVGSILYSKY